MSEPVLLLSLPNFFNSILPVIAYNNVIEQIPNSTNVQKNRGHYCRATVQVSKTQQAHLIHNMQTLRTKAKEAFISRSFGVWSSSCIFVLYHLCFYICALRHTACLILWHNYDFCILNQQYKTDSIKEVYIAGCLS